MQVETANEQYSGRYKLEGHGDSPASRRSCGDVLGDPVVDPETNYRANLIGYFE